jgi:hypothetical protein
MDVTNGTETERAKAEGRQGASKGKPRERHDTAFAFAGRVHSLPHKQPRGTGSRRRDGSRGRGRGARSSRPLVVAARRALQSTVRARISRLPESAQLKSAQSH